MLTTSKHASLNGVVAKFKSTQIVFLSTNHAEIEGVCDFGTGSTTCIFEAKRVSITIKFQQPHHEKFYEFVRKQ